MVTTPVLARGRVNNSLGGCHVGDSILEGLLDVKLNKVIGHIILLMVDVHENGLGVALGGVRVDDLLGATVNDGLGRLLGE